MRNRRLKCLACGIEKEDNLGLVLFCLPAITSRRVDWLRLLNRIDLVDKKIPQDLRVCERHFSKENYCQFSSRLKWTALPDIVVPIPIERRLPQIEDTDSSSMMEVTIKNEPEEEEEFLAISVEDAQNMRNVKGDDASMKIRPEDLRNESCKMYKIDATHIPKQTTTEDDSLEIIIKKLRRENEELKEKIEVLETEKGDYNLYLQQTRELLPPGLAKLVEAHITNFNSKRKG